MHAARKRRPDFLGRPVEWWAVFGVIVGLLTCALLLVPLVPEWGHGDLSRRGLVLLLVFAAMYAFAELFVLHIQVKREAQTLALSEIPLVLALTFATPTQLVFGTLLGAAAAYVLHRRQRGLKLAYNMSLKAVDAVVTLLIYELVLDGSDELTPQWMLACYAAVAMAGLVDGLVTQLVIGLHERSLSVRSMLHDVAVYPALALAVATLAIVVAFAFDASPLSALPAAASGVCLFIGYRAYSKLSERHLSLERLYRFSQAVTTTPEVDETLTHVLSQAKELLHSENAEITFFSGQRADVVRVALSPSGRLVRESVRVERDDPTSPAVVDARGPAMLSRSTREPRDRAHLTARRWREAIVVPLRGDAGVIGTLSVADRMGKVRDFDHSDVRLLETVANHAGVALQNSRLIDRLRHESLHDALTGLPNRVLLRNNAAEQLEAVASGASVGCAVMIMDLDGFKDINDTLGHQHGDELLKMVATRASAATGPSVTVARLGGDEFAILLPGCSDGPQAYRTAAAILAALREPTELDGIAVHVGASIGIALAPSHATDVTGLLRYADVAMYAAKHAGGGAKVYESDTDSFSPERLALVMELRTALDDGQLSVHVQPKTTIATREVDSVEMLARWDHPRHGLIAPDEFIPLAERAGLMRQLTAHVLRLALDHCADWRRQGREINVAVNLSPRSLSDPDLRDLVERLLEESGVPARLLTLEITESTVMAEPDEAMKVLRNLRALGVRLSIDDFGVGYSSLSNLSRMPVHELKIDRSFVHDLADSVDSTVITRSIIDLGRNLGLDVVAEGVEDQQAWDVLAAAGCQLAQGFFLARPMPPGQLSAWLDRWHGGLRDQRLAEGVA
jgi:diguanylate cyclase (GGDEF)-like protein